MIYVIDQSSMRGPELSQLVRSTNFRFVVPDAAFEEMTNSAEWEATVRRSFEILAPALDRVDFAAGLGELLRYEKENGRPIGEEQLVPRELTDVMREFVCEILAGPKALGELRKAVLDIREEIAFERPGGSVLKEQMARRIALLKKLYGPQLTRYGRSGLMGNDARLGQLKVLSEAFVDEFVDSCLANSACATTRVVYAQLWHVDRWLRLGGLDPVKPERLAHDAYDAEYAVTASFFDSLLTNDKDASQCAANLRLMSSPDVGERLVEAYARYLSECRGKHGRKRVVSAPP